jgi:hypothetical protein
MCSSLFSVVGQLVLILSPAAGFIAAGYGMLARDGVQFIASGIYTKHMIEQLGPRGKSDLSDVRGILLVASLSILLSVLTGAPDAKAQNVAINGNVPSGPASDRVLRLTFRDAIMALKYKLGAIVRDQRLLALSKLESFSIMDDRRANTPRMYLYVDDEHHKAIPFRSVSLHRKLRPARSCEEFSYADS